MIGLIIFKMAGKYVDDWKKWRLICCPRTDFVKLVLDHHHPPPELFLAGIVSCGNGVLIVHSNGEVYSFLGNIHMDPKACVLRLELNKQTPGNSTNLRPSTIKTLIEKMIEDPQHACNYANDAIQEDFAIDASDVGILIAAVASGDKTVAELRAIIEQQNAQIVAEIARSDALQLELAAAQKANAKHKAMFKRIQQAIAIDSS